VTIAAEIRHDFSRLRLDVAFVTDGGLTALVGPSGAGKTTVLNALAGVVHPDRCIVRFDDEVIADTTAGIWRPAHRRGIGYVFQEPRLLPHLTVEQNLQYGRWFRDGSPRAVALDDVVRLMNLEPLLRRRPSRLSGGEKQRVALGRALLAHPRLLLLDEPLASVDRAHRDEILPALDRLRAEHAVPVIYVTHAWTEVASRADRAIVLRDGQVVFNGPAADAAGHGV